MVFRVKLEHDNGKLDESQGRKAIGPVKWLPGCQGI